MRDKGASISGVYTINPDDGEPFKVSKNGSMPSTLFLSQFNKSVQIGTRKVLQYWAHLEWWPRIDDTN